MSCAAVCLSARLPFAFLRPTNVHASLPPIVHSTLTHTVPFATTFYISRYGVYYVTCHSPRLMSAAEIIQNEYNTTVGDPIVPSYGMSHALIAVDCTYVNKLLHRPACFVSAAVIICTPPARVHSSQSFFSNRCEVSECAVAQ
jgi:hypothetical protein